MLPTAVQNVVKGETGTDTLRRLALETENTGCRPDKRLHISTDGSQMDGYISFGAAIYCELFARYVPLGHHSTAFDGEIEAIHTALRLMYLH